MSKDIKIISEWKKHKPGSTGARPKPGYKRVMAVVDGETRHIDIPKHQN